MKTRTMNVLTPLAALAFAFGAQAFTAQTEGFESIAAGQGVGSAQKFVYVPPTGETVADASVVTAYSGDTPSVEAPAPFTDFGNNYLKLSTEDGTLLRSINALNEGAIGAAATVPAEGITIDTVMQFTVTDSSDRPEPGSDDKFTMWLDKDGETVQLMVCGGKFDYANNESTLARAQGYAMYSLDGDFTIAAGSWHRVTIEAIANANTNGLVGALAIPGFKIFIDGELASATRVPLAAETDITTNAGIFTNDGDAGDAPVAEGLAGSNPTVIPSLKADATLAAVGFAGEGKVDDLVINDNSVVPVSFTITAPAGCSVDTANLPSGVTYDAGTFTAESAGDYTFTFLAADGKLFANGAKSTTKSVSIEAGTASYEPTLDQEIVDSAMSITVASVKTEYLSLEAAVAAAQDGETIVFEKDFAGVFKTGTVAENKFYNGLTIDLNNKTWTFQGGDNARMIECNWSNSLKFVNGSITAAQNSTNNAFYSYCEMLEFDNVALDFRNLFMYADASGDPRKNTAIVSQHGSVKFSGSTTVQLANGQRLVTMLDRAQAKYVPGTLTIDVNGTIPGDILLYSACGFEVGANTVLGGDVCAGAANYSSFQPAGAVGTPFQAILGAILPATGNASVNTPMGKFYYSFADAMTAAQAGDTITLVNTNVSISATYNKDLVIDCGGMKLANAKQTLAVSGGADLKVKNGEICNALAVSGTAGKIELADIDGNTFFAGSLISITAAAADGVFVTGCSIENATTSLLSIDNANTKFYVYGNTFGKKGVGASPAIGNAGRPQLQVCKVAAVFIEGNTFKDNTDADYADDYDGKLTGSRTAGLSGAAIGLHATYHNSTPDAAIVVNGNDFSDVSYVIGIDSEDFDNVPFAVPGLVFNANTVGSASMTSGVYKYKNDVLDYTGKYSTADRLAMPAGVTTCYAWATGDNAATPFYVNSAYAADLAAAVVDDVVIALPGSNLSTLGAGLTLTADPSFANKWAVSGNSSPLPDLPATPTDEDVVNTLKASDWTDPAVTNNVKTVAEYNAFKSWADANSLNSDALTSSAQAYNSFVLGTTTLLTEQPEVTITDIANAADGCTLTITIKGETTQAAIDAAVANVAALLKMGPALGDMASPDGSTHGTLSTSSGSAGTYTVKGVPAAGATSWFMILKK